MHKHRQRLDLTPAVAPLNTHSFPPQKQYRSPLDYIAVRDCRRRRTFPSLSLFTYIYFVVYLFLPQHRQRINTYRPPRIRLSDHRSISGPLSISLVCDFSLVSRFCLISPKAVSSAIDPFPYVSLSRSNTKNLSRSLCNLVYPPAVAQVTPVYPPSCYAPSRVPLVGRCGSSILLILPYRTYR